MADMQEVKRAAQSGDLIVLPTDTVYGIGADPFDPAAVAKLLGAKGRAETMPPPVLVADTATAFALIDLDALNDQGVRAAGLLAEAFWPGPLTLVVPTSVPFGWDLGRTGGTVAVRVPAHERALEVLRACGPLAVTSANPTGMPPALSVGEAEAYFGQNAAVYVDGGAAHLAQPSTILDCTAHPPLVLREGALSWEQIKGVLEL